MGPQVISAGGRFLTVCRQAGWEHREAIERENKRLVSRLKFASLRQSAVVEDVDMKSPTTDAIYAHPCDARDACNRFIARFIAL